MNVFLYDKTFDGLLSAIFDAYRRRLRPDALLECNNITPLFTDTEHRVDTAPDKAARVWTGLRKKLPQEALGMLTYAWLSEREDSDMQIFRYICKVFDMPDFNVFNFADADVLSVKQAAQKTSREKSYVIQFVRFQKTREDIYFALISPHCNVLPLVTGHFMDRFGDQRWAIYDESRGYGYFYDLRQIAEISLDNDGAVINGKLDDALLKEDEALYQRLWKNYFTALSIKERANPKLQRRHMPQRFWKHLTEKQSL